MKNITDYVKYYDNVLSDDICEELITIFNKHNVNTSPFYTNSKKEWAEGYRSFHEINVTIVSCFKDLINPIYSAAQSVYKTYERDVGTFFPEKYGFENLRMKRYNNDDHDQFGWHADVGNYASARRYLVMFFYLNDVEFGGETQFEFDKNYNHLDAAYFTIKPKRGRIAVFPPMWMFPHRGNKPISGPKYILSTYAHYQ